MKKAGDLTAFIVATAALFLGSIMATRRVVALLLGMALHFLATHEECKPCIEVTARPLLRIV